MAKYSFNSILEMFIQRSNKYKFTTKSDFIISDEDLYKTVVLFIEHMDDVKTIKRVKKYVDEVCKNEKGSL